MEIFFLFEVFCLGVGFGFFHLFMSLDLNILNWYLFYNVAGFSSGY